MAPVHSSPFAGQWYPAAAGELERLLDQAFESSRQRTGSFLFSGGLGFVVPHAGPAYSGTVAAAAYRSLAERPPKHVFFLAFPHRGGLHGVAVPDADSVATPLGEVRLTREFAAGFPVLDEERLCDHSFEIQLPFLQKAAPDANVTALYVGPMDAAERAAAADRLAAAWRPGTVFVASSDFTHYGRGFGNVPFPPEDARGGRLRELDGECIEAAGSVNAALFLKELGELRATVCGYDPIALLLETVRRLEGPGFYQAKLDYQTSGEITGDFRNSVSYAALGYYPRAAFDLEEADRDALLASARATLEQLRETGRREPIPARHGSAALAVHRGVFVTLRQGDELLGCIGNISGRGPLAKDVADLALAAALDDPRFRPAAKTEGPIDIEISLLTPLRRIAGRESFCAGRHGALLKLDGHTGLLLPQVATEHGWDADQFLKALARKSRLGPDAIDAPRARLYRFEAQVFGRAG
jgi:AmmeMemoRadiSam system protein B/AmmeMemoRadiSam system protein A